MGWRNSCANFDDGQESFCCSPPLGPIGNVNRAMEFLLPSPLGMDGWIHKSLGKSHKAKGRIRLRTGLKFAEIYFLVYVLCTLYEVPLHCAFGLQHCISTNVQPRILIMAQDRVCQKGGCL